MSEAMASLTASLSDNAQILISLVPAVRDASTDAIHDARVATRRLRGALDVLKGPHMPPRLEEAAALARRVARALSRVRDIDVSLALLADLERRAPAAAPAAALCRRELLRARTLARRRLVKKFDELPVETLPGLIAGPAPRLNSVLVRRGRERARAVAEAVNYASGVYFPRRAHAARVELKKLRYLLEFSDFPDETGLKLLRKSQEILGDIQDRQVLYETVEAMRDESVASGADLDPLLGLLEAECGVIYERFLARRGEVLALCHRIAGMPARHSLAVKGTLITIGAVAAGSVWQLGRRHTRDVA